MATAKVNEELIQRVVNRLVAEYAPQQVILFGSYAYGMPDEDSDIDLLIVKETEEPFMKRVSEARRAAEGTHTGIPVDFFVLTPDEMNSRLWKGDHFIEDIVENGLALYGEASWKKEGVLMTGGESSYPMDWLIIAERDLHRVGVLLASEDSEGADFHLQQALEKALKAFLIYSGWRLQRTHNLVSLLDFALAYDPGLEEFRPLCKEVSEYYFAERYPGIGHAGPGMVEVRDNLAKAREIVVKIRADITG